MKPDINSLHLLGITRSKAKMFEYSVPNEYHIEIYRDPARLFTLSIGLLGELAALLGQENEDQVLTQELKKSLSFSAQFFDAYLQAQLNNELRPFLLLLGSASYYLCELPGSSHLLALDIGQTCPNLGTRGLESLLHWLLKGKFFQGLDIPASLYRDLINRVTEQFIQYYSTGTGQYELLEIAKQLRSIAYEFGSARELLLADIINAIVRKRYENSTWYSLPIYTGLTVDQLRDVLLKASFIKELWPAQHLLGVQGVYRGKSAVVQMPTSAGKTKATEIIIRSAFVSERTTLAVVVAPFRTLCHEIKDSFIKAFSRENVFVDELSDILQIDFSIEKFLDRKQILVVTPEKLNYVLHHIPELGAKIGLLILDEGHQFDNGIRGITYELLITSLKEKVSISAQKILISAVIGNAEQVGQWLNGYGSEIISGTNLSPTLRSIGFASWKDPLGRIWFVNPLNPDDQEFYVPRIIEQFTLLRLNNREKERLFPEKSDEKGVGKDIALYLGLKLVLKGSLAIFCGTKGSVEKICRRSAEIFQRQVPLTAPVYSSNRVEIQKLTTLISGNFGENSTTNQCAKLGIFAHHSNIPHGMRLAIEYALKEGLIRFVICTSTLAQGVNLPIRYLIVTSTYQGREQISVRDFQNLIGRTGRSGMHTEGSILFSDPEVYDTRNLVDERWRWRKVKGLLNSGNSEPCNSTLFSIFKPLESDDHKQVITMSPLDLINKYIQGPDKVENYIEEIAESLKDHGFSIKGLREQVDFKLGIISAIENYLMTHLDNDHIEFVEEKVRNLAGGTLAYFLGDEEQKAQIEDLFVLLAQNIEKNVADPKQRLLFGKTMFGLHDSIRISGWLSENIDNLLARNGEEELLNFLWPIMSEMIACGSFVKCNQPDALLRLAKGWTEGISFDKLFQILVESGARIKAGKRLWEYKLDDVVELCEKAISYEGTMVLGAIIDFLENFQGEKIVDLIAQLQVLLKKLKYGLSSSHALTLYDIGFSDRVVSIALTPVFEDLPSEKDEILRSLKTRQEQVFEILEQFPSYFSEVYRNLTH